MQEAECKAGGHKPLPYSKSQWTRCACGAVSYVKSLDALKEVKEVAYPNQMNSVGAELLGLDDDWFLDSMGLIPVTKE